MVAEAERLKVELWRERCLLEAGYPTWMADKLAREQEIDLHHAIDLLKQGCSPQHAYEILT